MTVEPILEFEIDVQSDQLIGQPVIYPELNNEVPKLGPPYSMIVRLEALADHPDIDVLRMLNSGIQTSKFPVEGDETITVTTLKSRFRPEVFPLLGIEGITYHAGLWTPETGDKLVGQLNMLDARNVSRNELFRGRNLRVRLMAVEYDVNNKYGHYTGTNLIIRWIAVEL